MTANVFVKLSSLVRWPPGSYSCTLYYLVTSQHYEGIYTSQLKIVTPFLGKGHEGFFYLWREEGHSYNFSEADLKRKIRPADLTCQYSVRRKAKLLTSCVAESLQQ